jgi:hypothetical protein
VNHPIGLLSVPSRHYLRDHSGRDVVARLVRRGGRVVAQRRDAGTERPRSDRHLSFCALRDRLTADLAKRMRGFWEILDPQEYIRIRSQKSPTA